MKARQLFSVLVVVSLFSLLLAVPAGSDDCLPGEASSGGEGAATAVDQDEGVDIVPEGHSGDDDEWSVDRPVEPSETWQDIVSHIVLDVAWLYLLVL